VSVATTVDRTPGAARALERLERLALRPEAPCIAFLVVLCLVLSVAAEGFLTTSNLYGILDEVAIVGLIALGLNFVVLSGEIDISVGSTLAMAALLGGRLAENTGGFVLPLLLALGVGAGVGLVNGFLVTTSRLPSIIVTLGTLYALRGLELHIGQTGVPPVPDAARLLGHDILGIKADVVVLIGLFLAFAWTLRHSTWGRDVVAVGGNRAAAILAGLRPNWTRMWTFVLVGACAGLAAMVYIGQQGSVQPQVATGLELQVIAAVVVGGTSITGGRGSSLAPLVGAILLGVIFNGMILLGIPGTWQDFFTGALILLAVSADVARRRLFEASR
jgi:ribose/xylose/arabinose/galactoside ABC-type transport system permease subunit